MKISKNDMPTYLAMLNRPAYHIKAEQWRMARAALKLTMRDMRRLTGVTSNTLVNIEKGKRVHHTVTEPVMKFYEENGVEFSDAGAVLLKQKKVFVQSYAREKTA